MAWVCKPCQAGSCTDLPDACANPSLCGCCGDSDDSLSA
jgi:hypothetical protein